MWALQTVRIVKQKDFQFFFVLFKLIALNIKY